VTKLVSRPLNGVKKTEKHHLMTMTQRSSKM